MSRPATIAGIALLFGVLFLSACVEREESRTESAPDDGDPAAEVTDTPTATSIAEETSTPAPEPTATHERHERAEADAPLVGVPGEERHVFTMNPDGSDPQRLTNERGLFRHVSWSPGGDRIAFVGGREDEHGQDLYVMNRDGTAREQIASDIGDSPIDWSPDGGTIAFSNYDGFGSEDWEIHLIEPDGSNQRPVTGPERFPEIDQYAGSTAPEWSPDGSEIVFIAINRYSGPNDLYTLDVTSDDPASRLTALPEVDKTDPKWSRDGAQFAFVAEPDRQGYPETIHVFDSGTGVLDALPGDGVEGVEPSWAPDGEEIAFVRNRWTTPYIAVMEPGGGEVQQVTDGSTRVNGDLSPSWSPSGDQIRFLSVEGSRAIPPCSLGSDELWDSTPALEDLAAGSTHIVRGTVVEAISPAWEYPQGEPREHCLQIMSDFIVEIDEQYAGEPLETARVRVYGGSIGPYIQERSPEVSLDVGDEMFLFLRDHPAGRLLPDAYQVVTPFGDLNMRTGPDIDSILDQIRDHLPGDDG